ncbi:MAG: DUF1887 family protein [Oscillospiraceae bacterium]|nr:DUF1887 family protein [Oscillospiraceae bacterium]
METLIELFDRRPLENILGVEMFRPRRAVYICPEDAARNAALHRKMRAYFSRRGLQTELIFFKADVYDADAVLVLLRSILARYGDCAMDITGGTDAVLFAAGLLGAEAEIPVFTYSRKKNSYYNIRNAAFADGLVCPLRYRVEDFFLMAGGSVREGRANNAVLERYLQDFDPFFEVFMRFRRDWTKIVTYLQRVSAGGADGTYSLDVSGPYTVKGERGSRIDAPEDALRSVESIGFILDLRIAPEEVSFRFRDGQVRSWLRDVGSVLETYVYKACLDTALFDDVRLSVIVDWEGENKSNSVSNELDVMCCRGVVPLFISCKTCDVKTEALNELAVLRDRFGGEMARAVIVTAERGNARMRSRAAELDIQVIELSDLAADRLRHRLRNCMNA